MQKNFTEDNGKKKGERFQEEKKGYILQLQFFDIHGSYVPSHSRHRYTLSLRKRCPVPLLVWHTSVVLPHAYSPVRVNQSVLRATPVFNPIALSQRQEFQKDFQAGEGREGKRNAKRECSCGLCVVKNISYQ